MAKLGRASTFPTGLAVASDGLIPPLYAALREIGVEPQSDVTIVSCNREEHILATVAPRPATIDIRADVIGQLAAHQLHWRLTHPHLPSNIATTVTPELVLPENIPS